MRRTSGWGRKFALWPIFALHLELRRREVRGLLRGEVDAGRVEDRAANGPR